MTAKILASVLDQIIQARVENRKPYLTRIAASLDPPVNVDRLYPWVTQWGDLKKPDGKLSRLPDYAQNGEMLLELLSRQRTLPPVPYPLASISATPWPTTRMTAQNLAISLQRVLEIRRSGQPVCDLQEIAGRMNPPLEPGALEQWIGADGGLKKPHGALLTLPGNPEERMALKVAVDELQKLPSVAGLSAQVQATAQAGSHPGNGGAGRSAFQETPGRPQASSTLQGAPALASPSGGGHSWQPVPAGLQTWLDEKMPAAEDWWASLGHGDGGAASVPASASTSARRPREPAQAAESLPLPQGGGQAQRAVRARHTARPFDGAAPNSDRCSSPEPDWWAALLGDPGTPPTLADLVESIPVFAAAQQGGGRRATTHSQEPGLPHAEFDAEFDADFDADFFSSLIDLLDSPDRHAPPTAAPTAAPPNPAPP